MSDRREFAVGDRVLYDPRWRSGRRLYATVREATRCGGYAIVARVSPRVPGVRVVGVRAEQLRPLSVVELLAEVVW